MKKKLLSLFLCFALCLSMLPSAVSAAGETFTMQWISGKTEKEVLVNGVEKVIYCMQYDNLLPVTSDDYKNDPTVYWEASSDELYFKEASQMEAIRRLLYGGYPYNAVGALAPMYKEMGSFADMYAADLTQFMLWSLMSEWGIPGNSHYEPHNSRETEIPGWNESYANLWSYVTGSDPLPTMPQSFVPALSGNTGFEEADGTYLTGALSISNPTGFKMQYQLSLPEGVSIFDADMNPLMENWVFEDGEWKNNGYTVYGGDTFYLQTDDVESVEGETLAFSASLTLPTDITQYNTVSKGSGWKEWDGFNPDGSHHYVEHDFQTMLSSGLVSAAFSGSAKLGGLAQKVGSLTVSKTVDGNAADAGKEFNFTVTLDDTTISGTYGEMTFDNGAAAFTLKGGESKTAENLPNGVGYTVTEDDYSSDGYVSSNPDGISGTIVEDETQTAEFTNTRNAVGSLQVTKVLEGNDTDRSAEFAFTVTLDNTAINDTFSGVAFTNGIATFTLTGGAFKLIEGLPNGVGYTVTEDDYSEDGYVSSYPNGISGTIDETTPAAVIFTNTRDTYGNLTVSKTVDGNAADADKPFNFTVTLTDTTISGTYGEMTFDNGAASFTLKGGESKTAENLPNGVGYTVTEDDYSSDGYVSSNPDGILGIIDGDETKTAEFTNTRDTYGNLTVSKTVDGNAADADKEFNFTVTLDDTTISGTYGEMTFDNGVAAFTLKHGESKTAEDLPNGVGYTVTEDDYSSEGYVSSNPDGISGTIVEDETQTAEFTNTRNTYGNLTVSKTVDGNAADADKEFNFTVTLDDTTISGTYGEMTFDNGVAAFTLKGGESKTAEDLPNGVDYTVTEEDYSSDGYVSSNPDGISGTIVEDETQTAEFTNTRNTYGNLTVTKVVAGNAASRDREFNFTVVLDDDTISGTFGDMTFENGVAAFTLKHGESKTAEGLPSGVGYVVTEDDYSKNGYVTTKRGDEGTIEGDETKTASFTNTREIQDKDNPDTGDNSNLPLWYSLLFGSCSILMGLLMFNKKRKSLSE